MKNSDTEWGQNKQTNSKGCVRLLLSRYNKLKLSPILLEMFIIYWLTVIKTSISVLLQVKYKKVKKIY